MHSKNKIGELIESRGLTRGAVARASGYNWDNLTRAIKRGTSIDKLEHGTVVNIAAVLGVDVDELRADCDRRELPAAL